MSSGFVPLAGPGLAPLPQRVQRPQARARAHAQAADARPLTWCVLALALLLQGAMLFSPQALLLGPWQAGPVFKTASGYTLVALLALAMGFGWLRRLPALAGSQRKLLEVHQLAGLAILVLLALHAATRPSGFLLLTMQAMVMGQGAGALRRLLGARNGRRLAIALLTLHVWLSCLVCAAGLLHIWFVYAYTA